MKQILCLSLLAALSFITVCGQSTVSAQSNADLKQIAGIYVQSGGFVGEAYKINGDATYEYSTFSDDVHESRTEESGTYELKDNLLHFKIIKSTYGGYNMLDPKEKAEAYRKLFKLNDKEIDEESKAHKTKTEDEIQLVKWGNRMYLMKSEEIQNFVVAANLRIEPRRRIIYSDSIVSNIFMRRGDENKKVSGNPVVPDQWKSFLLNAPINAIIKKVEQPDKEKIYTINKGSIAGLKVGMCLIGVSKKLDSDNLLWVVSVEKHTAKLQLKTSRYPPNYRAGEKLTTKAIKN